MDHLTQGTCGHTSQTELLPANQAQSSLRTCQDTLPSGCVTSCATWDEWVTEQRGECLARLKSARLINASGSSSSGGFPTPVVGDSWTPSSEASARREGAVRGNQDLADTVGGRCQQREPKREADEDACVDDQGIRHEAEPELGGTVDGTASGMDVTPGALVNRVDRLRLLDNGVVNQTAAKAFATLSARLTDHLETE